MSELKPTTVYDAYWKANSVGEGTDIQVYRKSEADKVIAELKKEIESMKVKIDFYEEFIKNEVNNGQKQEAIRFSYMSLRPFQNP